MTNSLHVCLYNTESESSPSLLAAISGLNFVRLVAEVSAPDALAKVLEDPLVDLVFFHLDPDPDKVVEVIDQVTTRFPDLVSIAISHQKSPSAIISPMRAGCDQFVFEPIDHADLAAAVARVASRRLAMRTKSRCVCVVGATGGAGGTSIACNLALEIGQLTDTACGLIDLDLQFGDVATSFDCEPKYTISDLASAETLDRTVLTTVLTELKCNVSLISCPKRVDECALITPDVIHRLLQLLATLRETVVIDLPRRIDECIMAALEHADALLVVCQQLVPSIRNAQRVNETLMRMGLPAERIQFVVNRFDPRNTRIGIEEIEQHLNKKVFATVPNNFQLVSRALDFGRPVAALDSDNPIRVSIRKLAEQLLKSAEAESAKPKVQKGFLKRLLQK